MPRGYKKDGTKLIPPRAKVGQGKGRITSDETKKKISESGKGNKNAVGHAPNSTSFKKGFTPWNKGKKTGNSYWRGKKRSKETIEKIRKSKTGGTTTRKGKKYPQYSGECSPTYKHGRMKDPEYVSWLKNKRNRMKRLNSGSHTFGEWETLKAQYNWTCPCCKKSEPEIKLTEDHIVPVSKGGSDNIENIQPLCRSCNSKKTNKIINKYVL